ncbi:MAG: hypothetical protein SFY81_05260 [Verrucomicrobiota bacterium]|nr:hypothetical protein [Verrucomicrobiota bacterium]
MSSFSLNLLLFAALELPSHTTAQPTKLSGYYAKDFFLIIGAGILLLAGLLFWAFYIRGPKEEKRTDRPFSHLDEKNEGEEGSTRRKRRRKHRRREHRSRNPTLAETGGLPPLRKHDSDSPPHP